MTSPPLTACLVADTKSCAVHDQAPDVGSAEPDLASNDCPDCPDELESGVHDRVPEDAPLLIAATNGDPAALAELFDRYHVSVRRFLSRTVGGADVDDLVQGAFVEIARGAASYSGRCAVRTWLYAVSAHLAYQHCRTSARRRRLLRELHGLATPESGDRLSDQLDARRAVRKLERAFERLSESLQLAYILCEVDQVSAREAARILETSEAAVWKRVSVARKTLAQTTDESRTG